VAVGNHYIVNFEEAVITFQRKMAREDLPTIDCDQVKWKILEIFEHIEPLIHLKRLVDEMVRHDWLYSNVEFVHTTFEDALRQRIELNQYLHACIMELGLSMHAKLVELGMLRKGTERYKVTNRPLDNETYTLRQTRD
jgi:hypothetical protein